MMFDDPLPFNKIAIGVYTDTLFSDTRNYPGIFLVAGFNHLEKY